MPIVLKKVSVHNLKGINLTIPDGLFVVFTGVSGSGKSSLLFDTIYAEGQRRYLESLSPHVQKALGELPKPDLQSASGLAPTIALEQRGSAHTPRSTVGTMTGIYDFMRVLYARVATPYCPVSGEPVALQSREKILAKLKSFPSGSKMILLSPYAKGKKGSFREDFAELQRRGFTRARVDGSFIELGAAEDLDASAHHDVDLVVDRIIRSADSDSRLVEAALNALDLGQGFFSVYDPDGGEEIFFSENAFSKKSGLSYVPLRPQDFSFNHPDGMCPKCHGLGCSVCDGVRLRPYPAAAKFCGKTIGEVVRMPIGDLLNFFKEVRLSPLEMQIAEELLKEIQSRLSFLIRVGLSYLTLERIAPSLSGGEAQRVRLASQIGSGLVGAIYVLDEPSMGLHPHDHERLLETLFHLRDLGNSVLLVEHDLATIRAADWLVDVGPGAGPLGGEILAQGSIEDLMNAPRSITGAYLSGRLRIEVPKKRRPLGERALKILGARHHNLQEIDVSIPLSRFTCVTGVSGSGKSSLISEILVPALQNHFHRAKRPVGAHRALIGFEHLTKIIAVDQSPIGRSPRSNAATYCKIFDDIEMPFKGKTLSDFLKMSVDAALDFFKSHKKLEILQRVGLGYLTLGQNAMTLSGGESQRIKLARELARPSTARTLYVLDEPTTGLHLHDLNQLIDVLQELVAKRSTVLVIEHNMELVKTADWVIDLGDGALLGEGSPEDLAKQNTPTGEALRETLTLKGSTKGQAPLPSSPPPSSLIIKGAKQNNLKNLSLSIPYNSLTVFTGPSGSGKSSLAFDTLFAEGQRRFAETLPSYARAYLKELPKPDAEEILGLPPVLAVEQKRGSLSSRSTVATMTNISNSLRILYSELGNAYHPETGDEILRISKEEAVERILSLPRGEKIQFLIPLQQPRNFDELLEKLNREGFLRIRMNGCYYQLDEKIPRERVRELYLVVDRLIVEPASRERLLSSIDRAPDGIFVIAGKKKDLFFNLSFTLSPDLFSFNSETGLCPECRGLGIIYGAHLEESDLSPLALFKLLVQKKETAESLDLFKALFAENNIDPTAPISSLSPDARDFVLKGASASYSQNNLSYRWVGLHPVLERLAHSKDLRSAIRPLLREKRCEACCGERLNPLARNVRLKGLTFPELCKKNLRELFLFFRKVPPCELAAEIQKQLKLLLDLGLHYLSLDRTAPTLSGGELQRIRLAGQLGSGLTSCLYIIDEPTLGLHPRDSKNLLVALKHLRDLGNTLILVEHEPLIIREANHLVEFGPRAGKEGGQIIAQGTIAQILKSKSSLTGAYLSGKKKIALPKKRRPYSPDVRVDNASLHNLKKISVAFPKGAITCLTGVSGAGKSSLMQVVKNSCGPTFEHVISVDQTPIGQTARADVASYSGVQTLLRTFFASLGASRTKGLEPRNFSPNHTKGMCRTCSGLGYRSVDLQFLPAVRIECEACNGYRLGPAALEIRYKGKHLGQILRLTIAEAHEYFSVIPRIARHLQLLIDAGLSYLQLGQELATLSGGEAQRLRLSAELAKREIGDTLYLIDEPTVGLHTDDVRLLLPIFHRLADHGNTLLIIEHHLDVIANADYVIDLGPEGGDGGGEVVATGTPEEIVMASRSHTGQFLKEMLKKRKEQRD